MKYLKCKANLKYKLNSETSILKQIVDYMEIESLCFSVRTYHGLKKAKVNYIRDLRRVDEKTIDSIYALGVKSKKEILDKKEELNNKKFLLQLIKENYDFNLKKINFVKKKLGMHSVEDVGFSIRTIHCLNSNGIYFTEDICKYSYEEIKHIRNLGEKSLTEILSYLENNKLELAEEKGFENENLELKNIEYNEIMVLRLLEKVFGNGITKNYSSDKELEFLNRVEDSLNTLKPRYKEVLIKRFGLVNGKPRTLEDIAFERGLTRERVRQIESKAITQLKDPRRTRLLRKYIKTSDMSLQQFIIDCATGENDD